MNRPIILVLFIVFLFGAGCAVQLPTNSYTPQNYVRTSGKVDMGNFAYLPFNNGKVKKANQIYNTAAGQMYIATDVADYVKRGTALELEKSGIQLTADSPIRLDANVVEFTADDLGYSVEWIYKVQYIIVDKASDAKLFDKTFSPAPKKGGKFGNPIDYANVVSDLILAGYDLFIRDAGAKMIFENSVPGIPPTNIKK
jgi:hypothetical protein|nr:MAG TPA: LPS-assembly protein [Bacteriophage sp.]